MIFLVGVDLRVLWYLVQILTEVGPCVSAFGADQQPRNVSKIRCIDTKAESMILWVGVDLRVPRYLVQLLTEVGLCVGAFGADQREDSRSCVEQTRKIWFWVRDLLVFRRRTGSNRNVTVR